MIPEGGGSPYEIPLAESGFTVQDFAKGGSHGVCKKCGDLLHQEVEEMKARQENPREWSIWKRIRKGIFEPPTWAVDAKKWAQAEIDFYNTYYHRRKRKVKGSPFAVITAIYKKLGGRIKRRGKATRRNPSTAEWNAIIELFETFHGFEPDKVEIVSVDTDRIPKALVQVGDLVEIVYKSDKFDGKMREYVHTFGKEKPILAAGANGKLYIIGGKYKITSRGIEG